MKVSKGIVISIVLLFLVAVNLVLLQVDYLTGLWTALLLYADAAVVLAVSSWVLLKMEKQPVMELKEI